EATPNPKPSLTEHTEALCSEMYPGICRYGVSACRAVGWGLVVRGGSRPRRPPAPDGNPARNRMCEGQGPCAPEPRPAHASAVPALVYVWAQKRPRNPTTGCGGVLLLIGGACAPSPPTALPSGTGSPWVRWPLGGTPAPAQSAIQHVSAPPVRGSRPCRPAWRGSTARQR